MPHEIFCDFTIMAAHSLPALQDGHPCKRVHGHNYQVRVFLTGDMDTAKCWIMDYADIRLIWRGVIEQWLDHRNLNEVEGLANPTCEFLATWIFHRLASALKSSGRRLTRIEVQEEPGAGVVYSP